MDCINKASGFESEVTSRDEELKALATVKKADGLISDMIEKLEQEAAEADSG